MKNYLNSEISHQIGLQRYNSGVVKSVLAHLKDVERDIVTRLSVMDKTDRATMEAYLQVVRARIDQYYGVVSKTLTSEAIQLSNYEIEYQIKILEKASNKQLARVLPSNLAAAVSTTPFHGRLLGDWAKGLSEATYTGVRDAVRIGYTNGETIPQITKRVRGTAANGFKDGVLEISRRNAETVARTAMAGIAATAKESLYEANKDLIKGVQWVSVLDNRTTEICAGLDGKIFPVNEGARPPAHPNCRSTTIPIFDGIDPPDRPTYGEWLKGQTKDDVVEVLGATRAELFLKGDLAIDRFTDPTGKTYTLEQLQKRDGAAFDKITE